MFKRIEPGKSPCCRSKSAPHQTNMTLFALTFSSMPLDKPAIAWLASSTLYHDKHDQHDNIIILYRPQYPLKCPLPREQRHAYGYTSWSMETAEDNFNPSYRFFLSIESITFHLTFWLELIKILPPLPRPSTFDSNPSFMGAFGVFFTAVTGELIVMDWCSMIIAAIIVVPISPLDLSSS